MLKRIDGAIRPTRPQPKGFIMQPLVEAPPIAKRAEYNAFAQAPFPPGNLGPSTVPRHHQPPVKPQLTAANFLNETVILRMSCGVRVAVPGSLELVTPYVLREQEDWFEDEVKFLRRLLAPGDRVIDIGANFGLYTLSMAQRVGESGRVWAFEPASSRAQFLEDSVILNRFGQVFVERAALSREPGSALLSIRPEPELNALVRGAIPESSETVPVTTLDESLARFGWADISFLKIDAEGEESNIIDGGLRFFSDLSPLVQYEVTDGDQLHLELADRFSMIGYHSYRLVPGIGVLVPFEVDDSQDLFLLNLFCCKDDRAELLAQKDLLVPRWQSKTDGSQAAALEQLKTEAAATDFLPWAEEMNLPFVAQFAALWKNAEPNREIRELFDALAWYVIARKPHRPAWHKYLALVQSLAIVRRLCDEKRTMPRLQTLARLAHELGYRALAIHVLRQLVDHVSATQKVSVDEPFLPACQRYDSIAPGEALGNWVYACLIEALELNCSLSTYYTGESSLSRLDQLEALGFFDSAMARRRWLIRRREQLAALDSS